MNQIDCIAEWNNTPVYLAVPNNLFFASAEEIVANDSTYLPETIPVFSDNGGQMFMHEIAPGELSNLRPEGTEVKLRSCTRRHYCNREEKDFFVGECKTCDAYEARQQATKECRLLPFYIVAYGISKGYGGPEEGGWWYDSRRILEVRKAYSWEQGLKLARQLKDEYPTCKHGRGSVLGGEDTYIKVCYTEDEFPSEGPNGRPRYE